MIRLEDILNLLFPGLGVGFIFLVVVILIIYGIVKFFNGNNKTQVDSSSNSNNKLLVSDSIYEYQKGRIVAEALPLELFLTENSKYTPRSYPTTTVPEKKRKVVTDKKGCKNDYSHVILANPKPIDICKLLGHQSSEGVLHTTYKGKEIWIDSYIKNVTIENLRQHKDKYVVCASKGITQYTMYTLKYKEDVINSKYDLI